MPSPPLPVLYSFRRCPYAMRARFALVVSGQRCELREVVLRDKPAELLAASPKATVPVLVLPDGTVLDQSLAIMRWALDRHDPARWLSPTHGTLAAMLALIAQCDDGFKPQLDRYKYPNRLAPLADAATQQTAARHARAQGALFLDALNQRLAGATHLFGDRPALADAAIAPFVRQFAQVDAAWFAAQPWGPLQRWLGELTASPWWRHATQKYPAWPSGSAGVVFPGD